MKESAVLALLNQDVDSIPLRAAWDDVADEFGVDLPREYKVLVDSADPIELFSFLFLINPFAPDGSFPRQRNLMIYFVRETAHFMESWWKQLMPYWGIPSALADLKFEEGNILDSFFPIGGTENADELWLLRKGQQWVVVVSDRDHCEIEIFDMGLPEFLRKFILGEILPQNFPEEILKRQGWPLQ